MKKKIIIIGATVLILLVLVAVEYFQYKGMSRDIDNIIINDVDVSDIADGKYEGEYRSTLIYAWIRVFVEDGKITKIKILNYDCGTGKEAEEIVDYVVEAQSLEVDTVSGATVSSKVILKAIENALVSAK